VRDNLHRLGLQARVQAGNAAEPKSWWDGKPFQRILADVPCSASGVVRRHPDIKWLRRPADIAGFAREQRRILNALWPALESGGKLLYATCSVFQEENQGVVEAFLADHADAERVPVPSYENDFIQLLPDAHHDGFFYALLRKRA
jgi:16S rRNA (cytosine967-C5)-methyltransferase